MPCSARTRTARARPAGSSTSGSPRWRSTGEILERSLGQDADLDQETARFLLPTLIELNVPAVVRRDKTGGEGTYSLAVRGEPSAAWRLAFAPGALDVTVGPAADVDASFEADPAALALLLYARTPWQDLEKAGRLSTSGSREAAERFQTLFKGP